MDREWTQAELYEKVRSMGIEPDPGEVIPPGVKFLVFPQPPLTAEEIAWGQKIAMGRQKRA